MLVFGSRNEQGWMTHTYGKIIVGSHHAKYANTIILMFVKAIWKQLDYGKKLILGQQQKMLSFTKPVH
jgi:hypothetical protein